MNVLLLSIPRSGSTYVSNLIRNSISFEYSFLDPIDNWKFTNNIVSKQYEKINEIKNLINNSSVFIRHNSHFFGLDVSVASEFEKLFNNFYIIKLLRPNSLFDITLSHCYAMTTGVVHDYLAYNVPVITVSDEMYLQEVEVCKTRYINLEKFPVYDEILYYDDVLQQKNTLKNIALGWESVPSASNKHKRNKISNYDDLYRKYAHDT